MKSPAELVTDAMNEKPEETTVRRALARARREAEDDDQLSDEQQGYKDSGMRPSDFL